jgi:hypothetical protein
MDEAGKIASPGAELKHSGGRVDARFAYHPREDIAIRRSDGIPLVPYVNVVTVGVLIVVENFAVSASHKPASILNHSNGIHLDEKLFSEKLFHDDQRTRWWMFAIDVAVPHVAKVLNIRRIGNIVVQFNDVVE